MIPSERRLGMECLGVVYACSGDGCFKKFIVTDYPNYRGMHAQEANLERHKTILEKDRWGFTKDGKVTCYTCKRRMERKHEQASIRRYDTQPAI